MWSLKASQKSAYYSRGKTVFEFTERIVTRKSDIKVNNISTCGQNSDAIRWTDRPVNLYI